MTICCGNASTEKSRCRVSGTRTMPTTLIHTADCARTTLDNGRGDVAEIINAELCGARDVTGQFRWLAEGNRFDAESLDDTHQLLYLIEGDGTIELEGKRYEVAQGAGVYLGPSETAGITHRGGTPMKLLHLVVPIKR